MDPHQQFTCGQVIDTTLDNIARKNLLLRLLDQQSLECLGHSLSPLLKFIVDSLNLNDYYTKLKYLPKSLVVSKKILL